MQSHSPSRFHPEPSNVRRYQRCRQPAAARLPRDVIASILLRLPASDLRRYCRVCKEWRDVISDPMFIKAHMVQGPQAPTHTVVFVPSSSRCGGRAFLFDEHWRLTAMFTAGDSEVMIGTCNGLLCFHDIVKGVIKVVEPFTGESAAVPVPTDSSHWRLARSYCFGLDATRRQFKIDPILLKMQPSPLSHCPHLEEKNGSWACVDV